MADVEHEEREYYFTLTVAPERKSGAGMLSEAELNALYEATGGDVCVALQAGYHQFEFARSAAAPDQALSSARSEIEELGYRIINTAWDAEEELAATLRQIVSLGTRTTVHRTGDMYADDGYSSYTTVSPEAELAQAALDRLYGPPQVTSAG